MGYRGDVPQLGRGEGLLVGDLPVVVALQLDFLALAGAAQELEGDEGAQVRPRLRADFPAAERTEKPVDVRRSGLFYLAEQFFDAAVQPTVGVEHGVEALDC